MSRFFNYFPKTLYTSNNLTAGVDTVTNIIARFGFESTLKNNSAAFYKYNIQESDTPEIIASKYYDNTVFTQTVVVSKPNINWGDRNGDVNIYIGQNGVGEDYNGKISNVIIYNKALTSDEILQNYNATKSRFGL